MFSHFWQFIKDYVSFIIKVRAVPKYPPLLDAPKPDPVFEGPKNIDTTSTLHPWLATTSSWLHDTYNESDIELLAGPFLLILFGGMLGYMCAVLSAGMAAKRQAQIEREPYDPNYGFEILQELPEVDQIKSQATPPTTRGSRNTSSYKSHIGSRNTSSYKSQTSTHVSKDSSVVEGGFFKEHLSPVEDGSPAANKKYGIWPFLKQRQEGTFFSGPIVNMCLVKPQKYFAKLQAPETTPAPSNCYNLDFDTYFSSFIDNPKKIDSELDLLFDKYTGAQQKEFILRALCYIITVDFTGDDLEAKKVANAFRTSIKRKYELLLSNITSENTNWNAILLQFVNNYFTYSEGSSISSEQIMLTFQHLFAVVRESNGVGDVLCAIACSLDEEAFQKCLGTKISGSHQRRAILHCLKAYLATNGDKIKSTGESLSRVLYQIAKERDVDLVDDCIAVYDEMEKLGDYAYTRKARKEIEKSAEEYMKYE